MSSLFCCLREGAAGAVRPYPCPSPLRLWSPDTGKGRGDAEGVLPDTVRPSLPGLCHDISCFGTGRNPAWMAWLFLHFCCSDSAVAAPSVLGRCPFVAFLFRPLRGMFPLSCIPRCAAGDLWKDARKQKGPPARSRWPLISRREAGAYSPATAFWCSAMTLSATGWGASS